MRGCKLILMLLMVTITGCASFTPMQGVNATVVKIFEPQTTCGTTEPGLMKTLLFAGGGAYAGNQFGGGNGKKAMTLLGLAAGTVAAYNTGDAGKEYCTTVYEALIAYTNPRTGAAERKLIKPNQRVHNNQVIIYRDRF